MGITFCSFSSGSSGNCYLVKSEETALLVDAGISGRKIFKGLEETGTPTSKVKGILITHEHSDHIKGLHVIADKLEEANIYSTIHTWQNIDKYTSEEKTVIVEAKQTFCVGDITVKTISLSHDTKEAIGYSFYKEGKQISIITDTGCITEEIFEEIKTADILAIEANHEVGVLEVGNYPYFLKRRILGDEGHLSNEAAANCIREIFRQVPKKRTILLSHLSRENNRPELAHITVVNALREEGINIKKDVVLEVILRDEVSKEYR